jgi:hypothetical protein
MSEMDGFCFLDEYSKFEGIINGTSICSLLQMIRMILSALKYPVVKKILRQTAHQRYSLSTNLK